MDTSTGMKNSDHVISRDRTPIGFTRGGAGPALLLVHGGLADHSRWAPVSPAFEARFTVYAVDRRGRGMSGDAAAYALDREAEDIAALVESIGGPVDLLGHSYGALVALEAALRTDRVRRLALYEPPVPTGVAMFPPGLIGRLEALVEAGDREAAVTAFFREALAMSPAEIEQFRAHPAWPARLAAAHTIAREARAAAAYTLDPARFRSFKVPTLLLMGSDSPLFLRQATDAVQQALPCSRIAVMAGQQHVAMSAAPELFTSEVLGFLGG